MYGIYLITGLKCTDFCNFRAKRDPLSSSQLIAPRLYKNCKQFLSFCNFDQLFIRTNVECIKMFVFKRKKKIQPKKREIN